MGSARDDRRAAAPAVSSADRAASMSCSVRVLGAAEVDCGGGPIDLGGPEAGDGARRAGPARQRDRADRSLDRAVVEGPRPAHGGTRCRSTCRTAPDVAQLTSPPVIATRAPGYRLEIDAIRWTSIGSFNWWRWDWMRFVEAPTRWRRCERRSVCGAANHSPISPTTSSRQPHIRRLNELHLDAIEGLTAAELDADHVTEALQRAEALVGEEPLRERGVELLMSALYRSGRHVQALRAYQHHRNLLADDVGVVPSPRLQRLNERILLHDPTLLRESSSGVDDRQPARNPYKGLRPYREDDAGDFFGRDALVGTMLEQLHSGRRLLAIVGPSGCGKSSAVAAGLIPRSARPRYTDRSEGWSRRWCPGRVPSKRPKR